MRQPRVQATSKGPATRNNDLLTVAEIELSRPVRYERLVDVRERDRVSAGTTKVSQRGLTQIAYVTHFLA